MSITLLIFGIAAALTAFVGGVLAFRLRQRIVLVLGVTAGVVLGGAILDLVPEAIELAESQRPSCTLAAFLASGLGIYMLLDRALCQASWLPVSWRMHLGPATLALHSLMDGMGIGLAFQINEGVGWLVALAVLTHDLADGGHTVSLCLATRLEDAARRWLVLNGSAPLVGVLLGLSIRVPSIMLAPSWPGSPACSSTSTPASCCRGATRSIYG